MKGTMFNKILAVMLAIGFAAAFSPILKANAAVIDKDTALYAKAPEAIIANIDSLCDTDDFYFGDIDANGVLDIIDVTLVQKHLAGMIDFDAEQLARADVNKDGKVNVLDCTDIQKAIVGLEDID